MKYDVIFRKKDGEEVLASKTIRKLLAEGRKLTSQGYTITSNTDFLEALNMVRDQKRVQKNEAGEPVKVGENSRYLDEDVYKGALASYRAGHGFSIEVRDPQGALVGGILGERYGNIVKLETTYYSLRIGQMGLSNPISIWPRLPYSQS